MHRGSFQMQLCLHLHAIMFTLVAACLTASTNSVIASLIRSFACSKRIVTKSKIFSIENLETFARAEFRKTKIYIYVASLIACCSLTIQMTCICLHYTSLQFLLHAQITSHNLKVFKAKCLLRILPGRCNCFARELSRPKTFIPWLREIISKVIFWAEFIRMSSIKEFVQQKITQEIHALQTDQSAFNTFSVLLRSVSRWLKKLNRCASNLGQTWKRNTEKQIQTKSTFGRIFRWFKLLILVRNVLLRLIY